MAKPEEHSPVRQVSYDEVADILTFAFTETPQPALAEEAADDVWVRYDQQTHHIISVDILNFSSRVHDAFGPSLAYAERTDPQRVKGLLGLPSAPKE